jgi:glycine cleavage system regulatory protein
MNQDQVTGILRVVVPAVCTWLASQGFSMFGDSAIVVQITAALVAVFAVVWSFMKHTTAAKIEAVAAIDTGSNDKVKVSVPVSLIAADSKVAAVVADQTVPNVT